MATTPRSTANTAKPSKAKLYESRSVFWNIWDRGVKMGHVPGLEKKSRNWFREEARKVSVPDVMGLLSPEKHFIKRNITIGKMYMIEYDPKWKDKLPYWDKYPLIFPYAIEEDRFHAINLHYLPRPMRARLMDALHELAVNKKYNDNQKLALSYQILAGAAKFRWFEPCIHTYLFSHVRSKFYSIPGEYWDIALFLPTERFQKKSKTHVWKESAQKIAKKWNRGNRR